MGQRFRNPALILVCGALAATSAISQEQPTQRDLREKYRMCALQERMFDGYCMLSIVDLIANPEMFDGRKVLIQGYVHIEFEGQGVYLHKDDFRYGITRNALWLTAAGGVDLKKCQDSYSLVRGTFRAGIGGHNEMFSGVLDQVTQCSKVRSRN
jgi:hypothetical protein